MSVPQTREQFMYACLRQLGWPTINIEISQETVEDRIDEALKFFYDYHFDGAETMYYKYRIQRADMPDVVKNVFIKKPGTGYANGDLVSFGDSGSGTIQVNSEGQIVSVLITDHGSGHVSAPACTITTSTGTGAVLQAELGGWIELPEHVIGAVQLFDLSGLLMNTTDMFSPTYQLIQNELFTITSSSMVPFYTTMMQLELIRDLLIGSQPIRYNRLRNRVHLDMSPNRAPVGTILILECWEAIDPQKHPSIWGDRFLQRYCSLLIKRNWGEILGKLADVRLVGNTAVNGAAIKAEAMREIEEIERTIKDTMSLQNGFWVG